MSLWVEIRCGTQHNGCHSTSGEVVASAFVSDLRASMNHQLARMRKVATHRGWLCNDGDWICPHCQEVERGVN